VYIFSDRRWKIRRRGNHPKQNRYKRNNSEKSWHDKNIESEPLFGIDADTVKILKQEQARCEVERERPNENANNIEAGPVYDSLRPIGPHI
jgi:hypothetical protein